MWLPQTIRMNSWLFAVWWGWAGCLPKAIATLLEVLRPYASDPRWRLREGVAMALQRLGKVDMPVLLAAMETWSEGTWLEKRAAAAAVAEPVLLHDRRDALNALQILDRITASMENSLESHAEEFKVLQKGMSYCWSVVIVALPAEGKPLMEKWLASSDLAIRRVMQENLKKNRLLHMDALWVKKSFPPMRFDLIVFDADDTLWHNERLYEWTQAGLADFLASHGISRAALAEHLLATEIRNIDFYGYGIKSFALSMIETAEELTSGSLSGRDVLAIIALAKAQLNAPVELLDHVTGTVSQLATHHRLMVITKGDPLEQERKMARSGLGEFFQDIEVVSDKTTGSYARLFRNHGLDPGQVLMVGDSLRSDILPVLSLGGTAVYIPYQVTWQHEAAELPASGTPRFYQLKHLGLLPWLLEKLETSA